jgi:hypothetical protein
MIAGINNNLKVSAKMAVALGIFLPFAETVRRINQILDYKQFFSWFDDYILGAILIMAAWLVFKKRRNSIAFLIGAWVIATAGLFLSLIGQLTYYQTYFEDPGIFSTTFVAVAKGLILFYVLIGLTKALKGNRQPADVKI